MQSKKQKPQTTEEYIQKLSISNIALLNEYIEDNYCSRVKTGKGRLHNFIKEHEGPKGISIIREILKFKRLEKSQIKK